MIENRHIVVTGAAGSIGEELTRQLASKNKLYLIDTNETGVFDLIEELKLAGHNVNGRVGDVRDFEMLDRAFTAFEPDLVFHCAALKHVTPNEWHPMEAVKTNIIGTWNVIQCTKKLKAKLVNISTDKVVHANSIMGATKKVAEIMVKNAGFISVRFGNVMGSRGSVLEIWQRQINKGQPLTITDERMERFMMTIPEAVHLVIKAAEIGSKGEILILDMGQPVTVLAAAKAVLGKLGKENYPIETIGIRPGETLDEKLMTDDEQAKATKQGEFYILR